MCPICRAELGVNVGRAMRQMEHGGEGMGSIGRGSHTFPTRLHAFTSIMGGKG